MGFFTKSFVLVMLVFLCVSQCKAQRSTEVAQKQDAHAEVGVGKGGLEQELMRLQNAINEAEDKKDFAALDRLLTDGYIFTAPNGVISDKKQLIEDLKNDPGDAGQTINYDEIKVYDYGNAAVVNSLLIVKGKDKDGKDYTNRFRNTVTWVKQRGGWRMAAIHVSRIRT